MSRKQEKEYYMQYAYKPQRTAKAAPRSKRRDGGIIFLVILISLVAILIMVFLFSDQLGLGAISDLGNKDRQIEFSQKKYYAVQLYSTNDILQAENIALQIKKEGGAGYIKNDGSFLIIAACYADEQGADSVISNINPQKYDAVKYIIDIPAKKINFLGTTKNAAIVKQKTEYLLTAYSKLYDLSITLDKGEQTNSWAKQAVFELYNSLDSAKAEFEAITQNETALAYVRIKAEFIEALNILENLCQFSEGEIRLAAEIKNAYAKIIFGFQALMAEI